MSLYLERGEKGALVWLALLSFLVLAVTLCGMVTSSVLLLETVGASALPEAILCAGLASLVVGLVAYLGKFSLAHYSAFLGLIGAIVLIIARIFLTVALGPFLFFVAMEAYVHILARRLPLIGVQMFDEQTWWRMGRLLLLIEAGGAIIGACAGGAFVLTGAYSAALFTLAIASIGIVVIALVCGRRRVQPYPSLHMWNKVVGRFPVVIPLVLLSLLGFLLRSLLQGESLTFYAEMVPAVGPFIAYLFVAATVAALIVALLYRFVGVTWSVLVYPLVAFAFLIYWVVFPSTLVAVICITFAYLSFSVSFTVNIVRQMVAIIPRRILDRLRLLITDIAAPLGIVCGGAMLLALEGNLTTRYSITMALLIGAATLVLAALASYFYLHSWRAVVRRGQWRKGEGFSDIKIPPREVEALLDSEDPESRRLGVIAADSQFAPRMATLVATAETPPLRVAVQDFLTRLPPDTVRPLLDDERPLVRARTLGAIAAHRLAMGLPTMTTALHDEDPQVALFACIAAYKMGLGKLATVVVGGITLQSISEPLLLELIEVIGRDPTNQPREVLVILKRLSFFTAPRVREAAMQVLGDALEGVTEGHADLLEAGLAAITHEMAPIRAAAIRLLAASGADNAPEHIALLIEDEDENVQERAAQTLALYGKRGVQLALPYLSSSRIDQVDNAIRALAPLEGKAHLEAFLKPLHVQVKQISHFPRCLLKEGGKWMAATTCVRNFLQKTTRWTALALASFGRVDAAHALERLAGTCTEDERNFFLEIARKEGQYTQALLPFLTHEGLYLPLEEAKDLHHPAVESALKHMIESSDRFLQLGALMTMKEKNLDSATEPLDIAHMDRLLFLKNIPYFEGLLLEELLQIDERLVQEEYMEGETIFEQGAPGDRFYIVYEGDVDLFHDEKKIATLKAGSHFAEMALFEDASRSATAKAATHCTLLSLEKQAFHGLMLQRPAILFQICRELSRRLRAMDERFALG